MNSGCVRRSTPGSLRRSPACSQQMLYKRRRSLPTTSPWPPWPLGHAGLQGVANELELGSWTSRAMGLGCSHGRLLGMQVFTATALGSTKAGDRRTSSQSSSGRMFHCLSCCPCARERALKYMNIYIYIYIYTSSFAGIGTAAPK